jgi:hypothetical protein
MKLLDALDYWLVQARLCIVDKVCGPEPRRPQVGGPHPRHPPLKGRLETE